MMMMMMEANYRQKHRAAYRRQQSYLFVCVFTLRLFGLIRFVVMDACTDSQDVVYSQQRSAYDRLHLRRSLHISDHAFLRHNVPVRLSLASPLTAPPVSLRNKKLSCRRETAQSFVSLNILLSYSRSFEMTLFSRACVSPY